MTATLASCWAEGVKVDDCRIDWLGEKRKLSVDEKLKCWAASHAARWDAAHGERNRDVGG